MKIFARLLVQGLFLIVFGQLWTQTGSAEIFLGEEPKAAPEEEKAESAPKVKSKKSARSDEGSSSSSKGKIGASMGISAGAGFFAASGSLTYNFNPYIALSPSYDYERLDQSDQFGQQQGPDLMLILRLPNPTMVTPVAGAGPGYTYWTRSYQDEIFDENQSPVMNYFGGVNIALTRNFGVAIHRRKTEYLRHVPIRFADRETKEEWAQIDNSIGFYAAF